MVIFFSFYFVGIVDDDVIDSDDTADMPILCYVLIFFFLAYQYFLSEIELQKQQPKLHS